ncbi:phage head morphogenesis protein SPP1 gp7 family [Mycoplasma sp. CAG:956]|jgi:hypothetical protein|nr:phage head morphogenesis protein SPP1 gp7 family [Mycoplasma sp. CAG:956]
MDNKTILNNRWNYTDLKLKDYLRIYKKTNLKTQDNIQDIFNGIDFNYMDLNKPISNNQRKKLSRVVDEWKQLELLKGYFEYKVIEILNKRYITNQEMLSILLWGAFVKERSQLDEYEEVLFTEIGQDLYKQGIDEIKPTKKKKWSLTWEYIWSMLCLPNVKGSSWITYIEALALTNAQEVERQTIIQLQQNKKPNIEDDVFKNILKKQQNRYISINDDKISGALDSQVVEIANKSLLKAGEDVGQKKLRARFIAEIDDRTTKMCDGMNGMLFYVNDWNRFYRYSDDDKRDVLYTIKGLEVGANLPPINNHFHYCRSTITYLTEMKYNELIAEYNQLKRIIPSEVPESLEEYAKLRYNNSNYYEEIKLKEEIGKHYKKDLEIGEKKKTLSFNSYYEKVNDTREYLRNVQAKDFGTIGEIKLHTIDRMIDRNITKEDIKNILEDPTNHWYSPINNSEVFFKDKKMVAIDIEELSVKTAYKGRGKKNE